MRKIIASSLVVLAALAMGTADAGHGARSVEGTILVPTATVPTVGTLSRQARCAYEVGGADSNGLVGWVIELEAGEGDGQHAFTLTSESANVGAAFYETLGTCDNGPAPVVVGQFFNEGDEAGTIPAAAAFAIVVIEGAADAAFTFSVA